MDKQEPFKSFNQELNLHFSKPKKALIRQNFKKSVGVTNTQEDCSILKLSDFKDQMKKVYSLHDDFQKQLDHISQQFGWNLKENEQYLNNPHNFDSIEWERIQKKRQSFLGPIYRDLGKENPSFTSSLSQEEKKEMKKTVKDRKMRTLGARRNWISMR